MVFPPQSCNSKLKTHWLRLADFGSAVRFGTLFPHRMFLRPSDTGGNAGRKAVIQTDNSPPACCLKKLTWKRAAAALPGKPTSHFPPTADSMPSLTLIFRKIG